MEGGHAPDDRYRHRRRAGGAGGPPGRPDVGHHPTAGRGHRHRHGATEALVDGPLRLTSPRLAPEVDRYARGFVATGMGPGERVAIWAPNYAEWMLAALGALRAGAVLVPLNTRFKGGEAAYIVRNAGASALVTVRGSWGSTIPDCSPARTWGRSGTSSSSTTRGGMQTEASPPGSR